MVERVRPPALTQRELDYLICAPPDSHQSNGPFWFHGRCHPVSPVNVLYQAGRLRITCATCGERITVIAVAESGP